MRWKIAQYFEALWWKLYLFRKSKEDYLDWKKNYWKQFYEIAQQFLPKNAALHGKKIWDAGCGPAGIFIWLNQLPAKIYANDPLLNSYHQLPHFSTASYPQIDFCNSTIEDFFQNEKFDFIFCINAINHVKNIDDSIKNLMAHLENKGILMLSTDVHHNKFYQALLRKLPLDILHPHQYFLHDYLKKISHYPCKILGTKTLKKGVIFHYELIVIQKN